MWLHRPYAAPAGILAAAGVELGRHYPTPVVELAGSRARALAAWQQLRRAAPPKPAPGGRPPPGRR